MSQLTEIVRQITRAESCTLGEVIQSLWSGYGVIQRVALSGSQYSSAIVKHIDISQSRTNRRGWSGDLSHRRKVRSYQIEKAFYESYASRCGKGCRIPKLIGATEKQDDAGWVIVLEDLDGAGFAARRSRADQCDVSDCLSWLADFHATFMHCQPDDLWPVGTYWHLETRPEEWDAMPTGPLKSLAKDIDQRLTSARFQTFVHGDAKLANFCFDENPEDRNQLNKNNRVAAVDFQYVGGGCGMKDVAYFISSCLNESEAEQQEANLLDHYFAELKRCLAMKNQQSSNETKIGQIEFEEIEKEWRELYPFAWADFCRFLAGWSPGHWKMNRYSNRITHNVVKSIGG